MRWIIALLPLLALSSPTPRRRRQSSPELLSDIETIQQYWGQITPYADNTDNYFGIEDIGLPDGCQVEQAHLLERHGSRFSTSYFDDGINDEHFAAKVFNWTAQNRGNGFKGPLEFLNTYRYLLGEGDLVGQGAVQSFEAGVTFWQRYGRILFNATVGQLAYNASFANGTARPKPVLRTTGQGRIQNSQINWALGFFGSSYPAEPNPTFENVTQPFNVVVIPEGGTENNTLASYDSCLNAYYLPLGANQDLLAVGYLGDLDLLSYLPIYLSDAQKRLSEYVPNGFNLTINDTYALQWVPISKFILQANRILGVFVLMKLTTWDHLNSAPSSPKTSGPGLKQPSIKNTITTMLGGIPQGEHKVLVTYKSSLPA